jgi:hypothetical protein
VKKITEEEQQESHEEAKARFQRVQNVLEKYFNLRLTWREGSEDGTKEAKRENEIQDRRQSQGNR